MNIRQLRYVTTLPLSFLVFGCFPEGSQVSTPALSVSGRSIKFVSTFEVNRGFQQRVADFAPLVDSDFLLLKANQPSSGNLEQFNNVEAPSYFQELRELGDVTAMSNIVDDQIVFSVESSADANYGLANSVTIAKVDLKKGKLIESFRLVDESPEPSFDLEGIVIEEKRTLRSYTYRDPKARLRLTPIQIRIMLDGSILVFANMDFNLKVFRIAPSTNSISKTMLRPYFEPANLVLGDAPLHAYSAELNLVFIALMVDKKDVDVLKKLHPFLEADAGADDGALAIFAVASDGTILKIQILGKERGFSPNSLTSTGNSLFLGGTTFTTEKQVPSIVAINFDATKNSFSKKWATRIDVPNHLDGAVHAIAVVRDNCILIGGETEYEQVPTASVTKAGDAFLATLNFAGELMAYVKFGSEGSDRVNQIKLGINGDIYASVSNNENLTHDAVRNHTWSTLYKIIID